VKKDQVIAEISEEHRPLTCCRKETTMTALRQKMLDDMATAR
jgi:hypothetical protein